MGDYNRPLSLNRWSYVGNNPIINTDPSGLWYCTGAPNCREWIQKTLDILGNIIPDGQKIKNEFEYADQRMMTLQILVQAGSSDIIDIVNGACNIGPLGYGFIIKPLSKKGMLTRPSEFYIDDNLLSKPPDGHDAALLGHEFFHQFRQSFSLAITIHGELLAAQFEARLVRAQGLRLSSWLRPQGYDLQNGVLAMDPYWGPDLEAYRDQYYDWWQQLAPVNVLIRWPATPPPPDCVQSYPNQPPICLAPIPPPSTVPVSTSTPQP
jgi:hypothetical protein